jgi:hypothetical protein
MVIEQYMGPKSNPQSLCFLDIAMKNTLLHITLATEVGYSLVCEFFLYLALHTFLQRSSEVIG